MTLYQSRSWPLSLLLLLLQKWLVHVLFLYPILLDMSCHGFLILVPRDSRASKHMYYDRINPITSFPDHHCHQVYIQVNIRQQKQNHLQRQEIVCQQSYRLYALSDKFMENDLIAVTCSSNNTSIARLCVVAQDGIVIPLCLHEDDVETDLFIDPRECYDNKKTKFWSSRVDDDVYRDGKVYGEGFYGQRPVPSLGGGPGYGALADEIWSVSVELLETIRNDDIIIPILDVGIAHGEKARGGSIG
jgi:hypothetical protein